MHNTLKTDICIIGGGSGGLSVASAAVQLGAEVVLIESEKMGGDCLNYGCIPSKSLLAAAKTAQLFRSANVFGIQSIEPQIDMIKIMAHVKSVIDTIAPHDSVERFEKLGAKVILGSGKFVDKNTMQIGQTLIKSRYFVIATGSSPTLPQIPGLDSIPTYTNETIFSLTETPQHLIIIGGGPIGCEIAQAFLFLGVKITVLEAFKILPHDEQDLVLILREQLINQGLKLYENVKIQHIEKAEKSAIKVVIEYQGQQHIIQGSHLFIATGRKPNVQDLNLEAAKVNFTSKGISVDARLRTSNHCIFAIGDVVGTYQFTHIANYHAGIVIRNILFKMPAKVDYRAIPWVTYTHPELAHVGLSSEDALKEDPKIKILTLAFNENDRAQTEHDTIGQIKIITNAKGKILGASILGPHAGELLLPWILAIQNNQSISTFVNIIVPYPTLSEMTKRIASEFYTPILFSPKTKFLVKLLRLLG